MKSYSYIQTGKVRFRRWTRKKYAAFASLGKQISIGAVRIEVSNQATLKQDTLSVAIGNAYLSESLQIEEEEADLQFEMQQTIITLTTTTEATPAITASEHCHIITAIEGKTSVAVFFC